MQECTETHSYTSDGVGPIAIDHTKGTLRLEGNPSNFDALHSEFTGRLRHYQVQALGRTDRPFSQLPSLVLPEVEIDSSIIRQRYSFERKLRRTFVSVVFESACRCLSL